MQACWRLPAILVFARAPVPGRVKTRLAARLGPEAAAEAHRACLLDTMALANALPGCVRRLLLAGDAPGWTPADLAPGRAWEIETQRGHDLGERLEHAFAASFGRGSPKVVAIGTDTPWMGTERLRTAFAWLDTEDVVLGPSLDGGYYLVGARRWIPGLFRHIAWGTPTVLSGTRRALERAALRYRLLMWDFDLDRPADLDRAAELLRQDPNRAPHLAEFLQGRARDGTIAPGGSQGAHRGAKPA